MPGEVQGCVGCHADRNYVASSARKTPMALTREAENLEKPSWGVSGFSFPHLVQPIFDQHCVRCHGRDNPAGNLELSGDKTDFFNVAYENLVRRKTPAEDFLMGGTVAPFNNVYTKWIPTYNGQEANILRIEPGEWGSKAALLGKIVKEGHPNDQGEQRISLSEDERLRIYMWMDLNVPYYGGSHSNYQLNRGCRQQIPERFAAIFEDLAKRRCVSCHKQANNLSAFSYPNQFALRIDNPELNPIMRAPLDPEQGGSGTCKSSVFKSIQDPDYQMLMSTFDELQKVLAILPRIDMIEMQ